MLWTSTFWVYEILWVWLWTVAYRCHSDGDCMFYSLCDLVMCMDDMFSAWFGSVYNFILFGFIWWISASFAWLADVTTFGQDRSMFLKWVFHQRFSWWFVLENVWWCRIWCMNAFIHISREPAIVQSFLRDNKSLVPACILICWLWKESLSRLSRFPCVFGFCCWLTPITPTVLCVSTCSDGLLDFHMVAELV